MNALIATFTVRIDDAERSLTLHEGEHFRIYPTEGDERFGEELSRRQIDLLRIAMAVHLADSWVKRRRATHGHRSPTLTVELLDPTFWEQDETYSRLKKCVDFLSGDDDWCFRFEKSTKSRHQQRRNLFRDRETAAIVSLYSGGLDSAAGLAARLAATPNRRHIPVTVRHQRQNAKLIREHFGILKRAKLTTSSDFRPFQAGVFVRNKAILRNLRNRPQLRETTHRCRPMLYSCVAGFVADSVCANEVEIYESGVGSVNVPIMSGPADYHTTRSAHPHFLLLISDLISHVNEAETKFVLPFADKTKGEMVRRLRELGLEEFARKSFSCTRHPLRRKGWQQCGHCPSCVFRRHAMFVAEIAEEPGAYAVDLFTACNALPEKDSRTIRAFLQQTCRMAELKNGKLPSEFRRYLKVTHAVGGDGELQAFAEVHRRYVRETDRRRRRRTERRHS